MVKCTPRSKELSRRELRTLAKRPNSALSSVLPLSEKCSQSNINKNAQATAQTTPTKIPIPSPKTRSTGRRVDKPIVIPVTPVPVNRRRRRARAKASSTSLKEKSSKVSLRTTPSALHKRSSRSLRRSPRRDAGAEDMIRMLKDFQTRFVRTATEIGEHAGDLSFTRPYLSSNSSRLPQPQTSPARRPSVSSVSPSSSIGAIRPAVISPRRQSRAVSSRPTVTPDLFSPICTSTSDDKDTAPTVTATVPAASKEKARSKLREESHIVTGRRHVVANHKAHVKPATTPAADVSLSSEPAPIMSAVKKTSSLIPKPAQARPVAPKPALPSSHAGVSKSSHSMIPKSASVKLASQESTLPFPAAPASIKPLPLNSTQSLFFKSALAQSASTSSALAPAKTKGAMSISPTSPEPKQTEIAPEDQRTSSLTSVPNLAKANIPVDNAVSLKKSTPSSKKPKPTSQPFQKLSPGPRNKSSIPVARRKPPSSSSKGPSAEDVKSSSPLDLSGIRTPNKIRTDAAIIYNALSQPSLPKNLSSPSLATCSRSASPPDSMDGKPSSVPCATTDLTAECHSPCAVSNMPSHSAQSTVRTRVLPGAFPTPPPSPIRDRKSSLFASTFSLSIFSRSDKQDPSGLPRSGTMDVGEVAQKKRGLKAIERVVKAMWRGPWRG